MEIVVAFLSGYVRQGRVGIGWATLQARRRDPAKPRISNSCTWIGRSASLNAVSGRGSESQKRELLRRASFAATESEQIFLTGVLLGEIRQGALEGLMLEALSKASGVGLDRVRRAVMMAGDIARVARSVLESGDAALSQYGVQLFRRRSRCWPVLRKTWNPLWAISAKPPSNTSSTANAYRFTGQAMMSASSRAA